MPLHHQSLTPKCCSPPHTLPYPPQIHNCDLLFKEDSTVDDLIDIIEGNRR